MKLILLLVTGLVSCATTVQDAPFRAVYVNAADIDLVSDDEGYDHPSGLEIGLMYGGDKDSTKDRAVGVVGDFAFRYSSGEDSRDNQTVGLDSLGIRTGVRYYFDTSTKLVQPYVGGALLFQHSRMDTNLSAENDDESALGVIGMVGVESQLSSAVRVNVGYSLTGGIEPVLWGDKLDLDTGAWLFGIGWSF